MYLLCEHERGIVMETKSKYFVVKQKAVPEVLLKVVEAKKLLESERVITVQEAPSISTKTIFSHSMIMPREKP